MRTIRSDLGTACQTGRITHGDEMVGRRGTMSVSTARSSSPPFPCTATTASYAVEVQRAHPGRLAIVKPVDPDDPDVADVVGDWKKTPCAVGIRIMLTKEARRDPNDPGLDRILRGGRAPRFSGQHLGWTYGRGHSDHRSPSRERFIIDHLGILQPRVPPAPSQPWSASRR